MNFCQTDHIMLQIMADFTSGLFITLEMEGEVAVHCGIQNIMVVSYSEQFK